MQGKHTCGAQGAGRNLTDAGETRDVVPARGQHHSHCGMVPAGLWWDRPRLCSPEQHVTGPTGSAGPTVAEDETGHLDEDVAVRDPWQPQQQDTDLLAGAWGCPG